MALVWWLGFVVAPVPITRAVGIVLARLEGADTFLPPTVFNAVALVGAVGLGNLAIAAGLTAALFKLQTPRILGVRQPNSLHLLLVVLLSLPSFVMVIGVAGYTAKVLPIFRLNVQAIDALARAPGGIVFVVGCLLPALAEEIFFRGFLGRGLVARHGVILGTAVTSLLFAVAHMEPVQACALFFLGLGLQIVFLCSKSLLGPVLLHLLHNSLVFFTADWLSGTELLPWPLVAGAALATLGLWWLFVATSVKWVLPDGQEWRPGYSTAEVPPAYLTARPRRRKAGMAAALGISGLYLAFLAVLIYEAWPVLQAAM
jgi:membrane protease YdiL (CAAX protease family)